MDNKTKGAWLLSQSKSLDAVTGSGAARLENVSYAGRIGRVYNLLRRNEINENNPVVSAETFNKACQLNNIDRSTRQVSLDYLRRQGRIDVSSAGDVSVIGASSTAVLEVTAQVFDESGPSASERAVLELSEKVADQPVVRNEAEEFVSDTFRISNAETVELIDICKDAALIDQESASDRTILFNSNTFRDGKYAQKAHLLLQHLNAFDQARLREAQEKLRLNGALYDQDVKGILGEDLYRRLISVGFFDRMEISNRTESVGYIASPNDFQKYGRPFEDDPIDDAKALLASLTYGQTRSGHFRGNITMPDALLQALIAGREVGKRGVRAIGEDYKELETRQVVQVIPQGNDRYTMKLLKRDVGELALTIIRGGAASQEALLMSGAAATSFKGPHVSRTEVRSRNNLSDKRFLTEALDRLRSGG